MITDYRYDSLYRISKVKTPNGKIIHYSYDGYGRQSKRITPDAGQTTYIYDNISNLTYTQDANQRNVNTGKYTFRNYDGLNRLTGIGEGIFEIDSPSDGGQYQPNTATNYLTINVYDTLASSIVGSLFNSPNGYTSPLFTYGSLSATAYKTKTSDNWNFKYYRYDVRGRVIKLWNIISGFDTLVTDYSYNSQDQITNYSHTGKEESKTYKNNYDYNGRLQKTEFYNGPPDSPHPDITNLTEYEYNKNSQVSVQKFNDNSMDNEYTYNKRNWISTMSNSLKFLNYENTYFRNGNVKSMFIGGDYNLNFASSSDFTFNYQYDMSNRLTATNNPSKNFDMVNTYDKDGNILTLNRNGSSGNLLDGFNYVYYSGTNKLQRVSGSGTQYTYDANGNMTSDKLNKNDSIKYDYRNLILELVHTKYILNDSLIVKTKYFYDEAGNRIRKMSYNTSNNSLENDEVYSRDVSGRELAIYENNDILEYPTYGLDMIGKIKDNVLFFYLKDHLGSVRTTVQDNKIISAQDYACPPWRDAWGYILEGRTYESNESKFKFTGKERDKENSYDYFGARYYDARIGRWGAVDPIVDQRISWSPYNYVLNNPLNRIDIDGFMDRPIYDTDGYFLGTDDNGLQGDAIVMNRNNFKQGMSIEEASSNNLGIEGLSGGDAESRFSEHFNKLKDRPDYDGYLTLDEANMWYQKGEGQSLFTALDKIDLSGIYSLGESFVGDERVFNLFLNSNSVNDALVYGSITLKRYPDNQIRAYADRYDFKMHNSLDPTNWPRNFATKVGETFAGEGNFFIINIYGSKKLESLFP